MIFMRDYRQRSLRSYRIEGRLMSAVMAGIATGLVALVIALTVYG